ncbi:hypothetical protein ACFOLF_37630 [Paenibacillus sepulcri]|uniref:Uncharacterized protein n=1 Tax=Paenibacillus sepulcri TaxID=359917 RepID=A0ABS7BW07_9BACL|nr:hypothetical protein [Paenibacillus sepulcri]
MNLKNIRIFRIISVSTFLLTAIGFLVDAFFIFDHQKFNNWGLKSTFILPPAGIVLSILSLRKTTSKLDRTVLMLNIIAFFLIFITLYIGSMLDFFIQEF